MECATRLLWRKSFEERIAFARSILAQAHALRVAALMVRRRKAR
jgi:hypothetical protein